MLPSLVRRFELRAFQQEEPVEEDMDEMVILLPGAPQGVPARALREEAAVEADAHGDAAGKEEKIPERHVPGDQEKDPAPESPRQEHEAAVEEILHGDVSPGARRSAINQNSSLRGAAGSTVTISKPAARIIVSRSSRLR